MTHPRVSVIVPTYNRKKWICSSLISIYGQTYRDFEIIVVDDGSTDGTKEVIRDFFAGTKSVIRDDNEKTEGLVEKEKLKYIRFDKNGGIPRALNKGYAEAKGDYICQLSSDDIWLYDKLEKQMKIMNENLFKKPIGLIYSDYYFNDFTEIIENKPKEWYVKCDRGVPQDMFRTLFDDCFMNACTFLMKKDFFKHIGPYPMRPEFEWNQDLWFNFQAVLQNKFDIYYQAEPTAKISIHENQASKQGKCGLGNHILLPEMLEAGKKRGWYYEK